MSTFKDGSEEIKGKTSILNLYHVISKAIIKRYYAGKDEIKFDKYLKDAILNLKRINLIETRVKIELERYHRTQCTLPLSQEKINYELRFFASMIGFIDGSIDDINREIEICYKFVSLAYRVEEHNNNKSKLLEIRSNILSDYANKILDYTPEILITTLKTTPAYFSFSKLCEEGAKNLSILSTEQELISAYNVGYTSIGYYELDTILNLYDKLNEELKKCEFLNEYTLKKEKRKKFKQ